MGTVHIDIYFADALFELFCTAQHCTSAGGHKQEVLNGVF
jgi:hypothetical protein